MKSPLIGDTGWFKNRLYRGVGRSQAPWCGCEIRDGLVDAGGRKAIEQLEVHRSVVFGARSRLWVRWAMNLPIFGVHRNAVRLLRKAT